MHKQTQQKDSISSLQLDSTLGNTLTLNNTSPKASVTAKNSIQDKDPTLKGRGLVLFLFCLINFNAGFLGAPLAPISKAAKKVYNQDLSTINLASSLYSAAGLCTGLFANLLIHKIGVKKTTLLTAGLYTIGMSTKMLVGVNFYFVHLGEIFAGLGSPFVQYGIASFSDQWYKGKQRGIIISVLSTMNPIGTMASFVYPYIFVSNKGTDTVLKHQIENLFLSQVI